MRKCGSGRNSLSTTPLGCPRALFLKVPTRRRESPPGASRESLAEKDYCSASDRRPPQNLSCLMRFFVTGAAGFIGSNLVDRLLADGLDVTGWDDFSTGQERFLEGALKQLRFALVRGDNRDLTALTAAMKGCYFVFHLAANADVRFGTDHPRKDLEQNTLATFNVLEAMRANGIKSLA